jgi:hypothetical protein
VPFEGHEVPHGGRVGDRRAQPEVADRPGRGGGGQGLLTGLPQGAVAQEAEHRDAAIQGMDLVVVEDADPITVVVGVGHEPHSRVSL